MMKTLKVLIFGSEKCPQCLLQKVSFDKIGVPFEFVDAMAADNQQLCDRMDVDDLPHSICFFDETMKPIHSNRGFIDAQAFMNAVVHRLSGGKKSVFKSGFLQANNSPNRVHSGDSDLLK
jgi:glutaredoxin-related protein